jgi:multifunctional methyltransferase subunit TRM112
MLTTRINYKVLKAAAEQMGQTGLPDELTAELLDDPDVMAKLHHCLLELHLEAGALVCPETGRRFPVSQGIPNMLLNEDEV